MPSLMRVVMDHGATRPDEIIETKNLHAFEVFAQTKREGAAHKSTNAGDQYAHDERNFGIALASLNSVYQEVRGNGKITAI